MQELLEYTERRVRAEIAALPHGAYEAEGSVDNDGYTDEPGPPPRAGRDRRGRASSSTPRARTRSGARRSTRPSRRRSPPARTSLKCLIDPDLPVNDGFYRLFRLDAPKGSVTNCTWPSPVVGGWETQTRLVEVMFRALLPAFPDRLPAGTKGMMCQAGFGSLDLARGSYSCFYEALAGGYGARRASDGPDAVQAHGQNTENAPIEETELNYPVRITRLALVEDSDGPGRFRGGLGLRKDFRFEQPTTFTVLADRDRFGPWGAVRRARRARGASTSTSATASRRGSARRARSTSSPGDVISVRSCGGGGYGPPEERDPERVLRDVLEGKVSAERARERVPGRDRRPARRRDGRPSTLRGAA